MDCPAGREGGLQVLGMLSALAKAELPCMYPILRLSDGKLASAIWQLGQSCKSLSWIKHLHCSNPLHELPSDCQPMQDDVQG